MLSLGEFAAMLESSAERSRDELLKKTAIFVDSVAEQAKDLIGRENEEWAPLAPSTVAEKTRLGFVGQRSATDPLLRTGTMRDSISAIVSETLFGVTGIVGAEDPKAVWQELGSSRIPPRPFLALAMNNALPGAEVLFGQFAMSLLMPEGRL